ncbi:MAG: thiamine ABC transporter substrate-binding protein [Acidimicrobiales bacterium]|nr:thiamine ABC transporter substrate-binding protein [Acidimicrobiales bacterium]
MFSHIRSMAVIVAMGAIAVGCGGADSAAEPTTVTLLAHESFVLPDGTFEAFTAETGITVEVLQTGDAGTIVANAIATAGDPVGDVLFGVDNLLLQRALDANVFVAHEAAGLDDVPDRVKLDPQNRVTPIDSGYVCVNYRADALNGAAPPTSLNDLRQPQLASQFVTQNPENSTPGLAFLFATIASFGEDGWKDFWRDLRDNGVTITPGWNEAWNNAYVGGDPGGTKGIVNSYASSPVFEGLFGGDDPVVSEILIDSCFEQIEFAGVLAGTDAPQNAGKLIDYLLSPAVQSEIPLSMFVEPVNSTATIPEEFSTWTTPITSPLALTPTEIAENQARWTQEWLELFRE